MSLTERLWHATIYSWGGVTSLLGLSLALIGLFVSPDTETIPMNWAIFVLMLAIMAYVIVLRAAYDANKDSKVVLPKVKTIIEPPPTYKNASALLLLEPTQLLSYDSVVSVYYLDGGIERLSGIGKVVNVQNDNMIQVILIKDAEFSEKVDDLKRNNPEDLAKIIVKPSLPSIYLGAE